VSEVVSSVKILIVEDESIVAMDMTNRLTSLGYHVVAHAASGEEAVIKARQYCT
jgi:CheY-like chemotaxis protein